MPHMLRGPRPRRDLLHREMPCLRNRGRNPRRLLEMRLVNDCYFDASAALSLRASSVGGRLGRSLGGLDSEADAEVFSFSSSFGGVRMPVNSAVPVLSP